MPAYDLAAPAQQQEGLLGVALRVLQAATWRRNTYTDFPEDVHFLRRTVAAWTASTPRLASTAGLSWQTGHSVFREVSGVGAAQKIGIPDGRQGRYAHGPSSRT